VKLLDALESCCGSLDGKSVLEIGCDSEGKFLNHVVKTRSVTLAAGVNPALIADRREAKIQLLKLDARKLPFADGSFDVITSISVFEHVHGLAEVLEEMCRVLKPGGYVYTEFGPIWSACWGHHLWFYHGGKVVDWRSHPLPPYAHLLMSPKELLAWCHKRFGDPDLSAKIVSFVFDSKDQNRLFFSDYEGLVKASSFRICYLVGIPDVPLDPVYRTSDSGFLFSQLAKRYSGKHGFGYHVVRWLLQKPLC